MPDGKSVEQFTLVGRTGITARVLTLGGTLQALEVPDATRAFENVTLGCATVDEYLKQRAYLGATIGRYANRIAGGRFELEGVVHQLRTNEPPNMLHGGSDGFDRRLWAPLGVQEGLEAAVTLELQSPDGDQGFPGALTLQVRYAVTDSDLQIVYRAETAGSTIVSPTSHAYWNLAGVGAGTIANHVLWLSADRYTPIDSHLIPTGSIDPVRDTPLDFTTPQTIGSRIDETHEQLQYAGGYDHNFVLDSHPSVDEGLHHAASLFEPRSRRRLDLFTTLPALQFYSGNRLDGTIAGISRRFHERRSGLTLEPQFFPDAPNQSRFHTPILQPGDEFRATIVYRFSVQDPDGRKETET